MPFEDEWRASVYGVKLSHTSRSVVLDNLDCTVAPQSPAHISKHDTINQSDLLNPRAQTAPNGPASMRSAIQYENEIQSLREQLKHAAEDQDQAVVEATKKLQDDVEALKSLLSCYSTLLSAQSEERISECERSLARARVARAILED